MIFIIALSLSMDAFSLSLAYGTQNIENKTKYTIAIVVGLFHFFMPLIGNLLGNIILSVIKINPNIIVSIILTFIGITMCFKKEENVDPIKNIIEIFLFALAVSLDSFSVGIGIKAITNNVLLSSSIFSLTAGIITYLGIILGNEISKKVGFLAPIIGGISLIIIGLMYVFK